LNSDSETSSTLYSIAFFLILNKIDKTVHEKPEDNAGNQKTSETANQENPKDSRRETPDSDERETPEAAKHVQDLPVFSPVYYEILIYKCITYKRNRKMIK
jgi:hypothetical protein